MLKRSVITYGCVLLTMLLYSFVFQQENQVPIVKIVSPQNNSPFDWDTPINYKITVSDKEDGESKFDEINAKEVLLEVRRVKSGSAANFNKPVTSDPPGLNVIRISNCLNCHNFNSKSIGPSFYEINKRYPATQSNMDSLIKRIKEGSSGIWAGKEKMPSHPELTNNEIKSTVQWVMQRAADPDVNYYNGTEGSFRIKQPPPPKSKGVYILTASYTDHGLKNNPSSKHLKGQDAVIVHSNK
ncbi:MAG TPA: c-type cytochrome [Mucilaginibacter sp.]|nr:c-type cytochrome [Mucilaginibacter sp.]